MIRYALVALGLIALGACASPDSDSGHDMASSAVITAEQQSAMTPGMVLQRLKDGNERFQRASLTEQNHLARAQKSATGGQYPIAYVLSCVDSRVPPEAVFDCGIGDIFVGRVAGNVEGVDQLGSMEFATKLAGSKLIVVLGHTACGAVKGACDHAEMGNLTGLLSNITPVVAATSSSGADRSSKNITFVNRVASANVRQTMRDIHERSPVIQDLVRKGDLMIVGGMYDLNSGAVTWLN